MAAAAQVTRVKGRQHDGEELLSEMMFEHQPNVVHAVTIETVGGTV